MKKFETPKFSKRLELALKRAEELRLFEKAKKIGKKYGLD